jgi:hypothetical protein
MPIVAPQPVDTEYTETDTETHGSLLGIDESYAHEPGRTSSLGLPLGKPVVAA